MCLQAMILVFSRLNYFSESVVGAAVCVGVPVRMTVCVCAIVLFFAPYETVADPKGGAGGLTPGFFWLRMCLFQDRVPIHKNLGPPLRKLYTSTLSILSNEGYC